MVLEYVRNNWEGDIPSLSLKQIARAIRTTESGTQFRNVARINKVLQDSNPSVRFETDASRHELSDIEEELSAGRPCIAWVRMIYDPTPFFHSVVITHYDKRTHEIHYNDPIFGKRKEEIGRFMGMWADRGVLIKISIATTYQKEIPEYVGHKDLREEARIPELEVPR